MIKFICILIVGFFALSVFDYNPADACEPDLKITLKTNKPKRTISSAKKKSKVKLAEKSKKKSKLKLASSHKKNKKIKFVSKTKHKTKIATKSKSKTLARK